MLEDTTYQHVVRWSDMGDSFIVLDVRSRSKTTAISGLTLLRAE